MNSPDKTVLENVDWIIQPGEIWLVAGLQGTGKSDLLSMLAGLTQPLSGDYRLFGEDMTQDESTRRGTLGRVSSVFEHAGLLHQLSVRENVILPLQYHSEFSEEELENRLQWLLNFADISSIADSYPRRLSRPWRRRAALARAMSTMPDLMLLDLPLNGLDPRDSSWWLNTLVQLNKGQILENRKKITLVISVDDLRPWRRIGCQLVLLKDGRLATLGREPEWLSHRETLVEELLAERMVSAWEESS